MERVLIIHPGLIDHYRIPIYGYLSHSLARDGFGLLVASDGIDLSGSSGIDFAHVQIKLSTLNIGRVIKSRDIDIVIDFLSLRHGYLFPTYFMAKYLMSKKIIHWGHGRDLMDLANPLKNAAYSIQQEMCDAIILYAEHLKKHIPGRVHRKIFIANNTLCLSYNGLPAGTSRSDVLAKYGITTKKNIICVGRMQKRKKLEDLFKAVSLMNRPEVGLILVGPDPDGVLNGMDGGNIFKPGPVYGDEKLDLISSADVYCLPGAVGLSIVDAFYCGLPFVTEEGGESAEIMYLKDGVNGYIVPKDDVKALKDKLLFLLDHEEVLRSFSLAARREIARNGNMDVFCKGFRDALFYVTGRGQAR